MEEQKSAGFGPLMFENAAQEARYLAHRQALMAPALRTWCIFGSAVSLSCSFRHQSWVVKASCYLQTARFLALLCATHPSRKGTGSYLLKAAGFPLRGLTTIGFGMYADAAFVKDILPIMIAVAALIPCIEQMRVLDSLLLFSLTMLPPIVCVHWYSWSAGDISRTVLFSLVPLVVNASITALLESWNRARFLELEAYEKRKPHVEKVEGCPGPESDVHTSIIDKSLQGLTMDTALVSSSLRKVTGSTMTAMTTMTDMTTMTTMTTMTAMTDSFTSRSEGTALGSSMLGLDTFVTLVDSCPTQQPDTSMDTSLADMDGHVTPHLLDSCVTRRGDTALGSSMHDVDTAVTVVVESCATQQVDTSLGVGSCDTVENSCCPAQLADTSMGTSSPGVDTLITLGGYSPTPKLGASTPSVTLVDSCVSQQLDAPRGTYTSGVGTFAAVADSCPSQQLDTSKDTSTPSVDACNTAANSCPPTQQPDASMDTSTPGVDACNTAANSCPPTQQSDASMDTSTPGVGTLVTLAGYSPTPKLGASTPSVGTCGAVADSCPTQQLDTAKDTPTPGVGTCVTLTDSCPTPKVDISVSTCSPMTDSFTSQQLDTPMNTPSLSVHTLDAVADGRPTQLVDPSMDTPTPGVDACVTPTPTLAPTPTPTLTLADSCPTQTAVTSVSRLSTSTSGVVTMPTDSCNYPAPSNFVPPPVLATFRHVDSRFRHETQPQRLLMSNSSSLTSEPAPEQLRFNFCSVLPAIRCLQREPEGEEQSEREFNAEYGGGLIRHSQAAQAPPPPLDAAGVAILREQVARVRQMYSSMITDVRGISAIQVHVSVPWSDPVELPEDSLASVASAIESSFPELRLHNGTIRKGSLIVALDAVCSAAALLPSPAQWLKWLKIPKGGNSSEVLVQVGCSVHSMTWNEACQSWVQVREQYASPGPALIQLPRLIHVLDCGQSVPSASQTLELDMLSSFSPASGAKLTLRARCRGTVVPISITQSARGTFSKLSFASRAAPHPNGVRVQPGVKTPLTAVLDLSSTGADADTRFVHLEVWEGYVLRQTASLLIVPTHLAEVAHELRPLDAASAPSSNVPIIVTKLGMWLELITQQQHQLQDRLGDLPLIASSANPASLHYVVAMGLSVLELAVANGWGLMAEEILSGLLDTCGLSADRLMTTQSSHTGGTLLHGAVGSGKLYMVRILQYWMPSVFNSTSPWMAADVEGCTPLHLAMMGDMAFIRAILDSSPCARLAWTSALGPQGLTPSQLAALLSIPAPPSPKGRRSMRGRLCSTQSHRQPHVVCPRTLPGRLATCTFPKLSDNSTDSMPFTPKTAATAAAAATAASAVSEDSKRGVASSGPAKAAAFFAPTTVTATVRLLLCGFDPHTEANFMSYKAGSWRALQPVMMLLSILSLPVLHSRANNITVVLCSAAIVALPLAATHLFGLHHPAAIEMAHGLSCLLRAICHEVFVFWGIQMFRNGVGVHLAQFLHTSIYPVRTPFLLLYRSASLCSVYLLLGHLGWELQLARMITVLQIQLTQVVLGIGLDYWQRSAFLIHIKQVLQS